MTNPTAAGSPSRLGYAETPQELAQLFAARLAVGDLDGLVALYEPEALFAPDPETEVSGHAAIREQLAGYVHAGARITLELRRIALIDDIALMASDAEVIGLGERPLVTTSREVARRQPDGRWLYAIDHPFFDH